MDEDDPRSISYCRRLASPIFQHHRHCELVTEPLHLPDMIKHKKLRNLVGLSKLEAFPLLRKQLAQLALVQRQWNGACLHCKNRLTSMDKTHFHSPVYCAPTLSSNLKYCGTLLPYFTLPYRIQVPNTNSWAFSEFFYRNPFEFPSEAKRSKFSHSFPALQNILVSCRGPFTELRSQIPQLHINLLNSNSEWPQDLLPASTVTHSSVAYKSHPSSIALQQQRLLFTFN